MTPSLAPIPPSAPLAIPTSLPPLDRNPAWTYLMRLSPGSRRTMGDALAVMAGMLHPPHASRIAAAVAVDPKGAAGILIEAKRKAILETAWWEVEYQHANAMRSRLGEAPFSLAFSTVNRYLCALRGVAEEAYTMGLMSGDVYTKLGKVKPVKGHREPAGRMLDEDEIKAIAAACDISTVRGARNAVVVGLAYGCGMRRAEVVSRDLVHLDTRKWVVRVLGKGNKERDVPVATGKRAAFEAWLGFRGAEPGPLVLPVTKSGRIMRRRLTPGAVLTILDSLGLPVKFTPHDLRRTFISQLIGAGADMVTVQYLVGHASVATTGGYDRRGDEAKAKAVELLK